MQFQYIGQMEQNKMIYCCNEGYFVSQEYDSMRKATRKETRQIEAKYGRLENHLIPDQREVLDIEYYVDNGFRIGKHAP